MALSSLSKKLILISIAMLTACTTIRTKTPQGTSIEMTEEEFSSYLEHVFRHHNSVADNLMYTMGHSDTTLTSDGDPLPRAEAKMAHACLPLNEVVSDSASGNTPDFWTRMRLADAVPACEAATRRVEELIPADKAPP